MDDVGNFLEGHAALHHLVVLVGPEVLGGGGGQGVEGHALQPLGPFSGARVREDLFQRVHQLHNGAELHARDRALAGEALVPVDRPHGGAVPTGQFVVKAVGQAAVVLAQQVARKDLAFEHHGKVHDVRFLLPMVNGARPEVLDRGVVQTEVADQTRQSGDPVLVRVAVGQEVERREGLKPPGAAPGTDGKPGRETVVVVAHQAVEGGEEEKLDRLTNRVVEEIQAKTGLPAWAAKLLRPVYRRIIQSAGQAKSGDEDEE